MVLKPKKLYSTFVQDGCYERISIGTFNKFWVDNGKRLSNRSVSFLPLSRFTGEQRKVFKSGFELMSDLSFSGEVS
jgi:hypothetical protein